MGEEEESETSAVGRQEQPDFKLLPTHTSATGTPGGVVRGSEDSPEVVVVGVMVVVVEEAGGAVETEGWEVGGTAEDEEEGEGVADSAAVGGNNTVLIRAPTEREHHHSQVVVQTVIHGMESAVMSPNFSTLTEHAQTPSVTVAGWGLAGWWAGHTMAGTGVLFV